MRGLSTCTKAAAIWVERLDLDEKLAWVWPAEVEYYTEASTETDIEVLSVQESRVSGGAELGYGNSS